MNIPEKLGKYEVIECVGRGSMGIVYAGHDPYADRKVAIKVCSISDENESQSSRLAKKLFFNEAHTTGSLDHPNILSVLDAGEDGDRPYIVLEFLDGGDTLKSYIDKDNLLSIERAVEILFQCAKALDYAHRRGVIHRDIKATNIMLTSDGRVKICDFGIAQYSMADETQVMGLLGSPRYMSPEQAREEDVTAKTDIYSLGVVAYEMLTGRAPFAANGLSKLINQILHEEPTPIRDLRPKVPEQLAQIVAKAMAKDLGTRYQTGQEMAVDLAGLFAHLEAPAEPPADADKFTSVRNLRFFNEFTDEEVAEVVRAADWKQFQPLDSIVDEGTLEHSFFIIVSGDVAVVKNAKQIGSLSKGDCFGEMSYVSRTQRSASIVAISDVELLRIDAALMEQASTATQLRFNQIFLRTLIERLATTSEELARYVA
ncbi:MAG: protein kinase [Gammaproteobacteria bacterium]|nr:protein kinase [Gammaproteobacteria bacterium]NIM73956.1 protein kinase [Gammaproteobacteria bacterium]NIN38144.1 protein kinase [Gammaproteobacteria bacterium]NIO25737.1 protein kinase [Gammaproteobacteria bacterium]NIO66371.1 protein kinase [Gammaproteobacteria bacterium]